MADGFDANLITTEMVYNLAQRVIDNTDNPLRDELGRMNKKDSYLFHHSIGVSALSVNIGKEIGLSKEELFSLGVAGLVHDLGKTHIPDSILLKPGHLDDIEYDIIKRHVLYGYMICRKKLHLSDDVSWAVLQHHERYDGSGYLRYQRYEITQYAAIIAIADSFHAMTTDRIYKDKKGIDLALAELITDAEGGKYDREITKTFCNLLNKNNVLRGDVIYE